MTVQLDYAVVTPARDEAENLPRLAACLIGQTVRPAKWVVVDNGSRDETLSIAARLAKNHHWIVVESACGEPSPARGGPIVRAFCAGLEALPGRVDVVVKLDADVSMAPEYFERLLLAFQADPSLGIAGGSGHELKDGAWRQTFMTRASVWGAARGYRWECLQDVLPLEAAMGWDSIDEFKANIRGWKTRTLLDLPFRHHRREGEREPSRWSAWAAQGRLAHYIGYRLPYLLLRVGFRTLRDPSAVGLLYGYGRAVADREPRYADNDVRSYLREQQALRNLPQRFREALGRNRPSPERP
jgi:glycosyltransferase involved in cell wall biosynthesis